MTGFWLIDNQWVKMHPASVMQSMIVKDKADFDRVWPDLPLPQ